MKKTTSSDYGGYFVLSAEEKRMLLADFGYIEWLERFTSVNQVFSDRDWICHPKELSEEDNENVNKLHTFYVALSEYCEKFIIDVSVNDNYEVGRIHIKFNGIGYAIGYANYQGTVTYVWREDIAKNAISMYDIVNGIAPKEFEEKLRMLDEFESFVSELKCKNVSFKRIAEVVNKYYGQ